MIQHVEAAPTDQAEQVLGKHFGARRQATFARQLRLGEITITDLMGESRQRIQTRVERVKLPGQSWEVGLRGVLAMRGLALSDRWAAAWQSYAAKYRKEVRLAA